ncbi:16S rRNA (cytidine(1402)-2'-O)-methyltransferase [Alphaproteobacteria bacterium KMM 3653]|uniref:Ribosomal RNA small subunit methyltransferase I n=1 Tax=Harenicola maris TaxID=2841044 RepID=A0AAP2CK43_9RHOB|nr:16S rRNA (cytidine(1402)-2'-O)-methyltransferase [Harenicola maris]
MSEPMSTTAFRKSPLAPGIYFVATPIGAARDITLRGLDILASADVLAAEDTRTARRLMEMHGVPLDGRRIIAYHDHNGEGRRPGLIAAAAGGQSVAYVSEAGTPLVADPGFQLGRLAAEAGVQVFSAPGPSAVLAALTVCGLPTDRFQFLGFVPSSGSGRKTLLEAAASSGGTSVMFESPKRAAKLLGDLATYCGEDRQAALCRELTKKFEEVQRGPLGTLAQTAAASPPRGECVVVVDRAGAAKTDSATVEAALRQALQNQSVKDAAREVAEAYDLPRREVYQMALKLGD